MRNHIIVMGKTCRSLIISYSDSYYDITEKYKAMSVNITFTITSVYTYNYMSV